MSKITLCCWTSISMMSLPLCFCYLCSLLSRVSNEMVGCCLYRCVQSTYSHSQHVHTHTQTCTITGNKLCIARIATHYVSLYFSALSNYSRADRPSGVPVAKLFLLIVGDTWRILPTGNINTNICTVVIVLDGIGAGSQKHHSSEMCKQTHFLQASTINNVPHTFLLIYS